MIQIPVYVGCDAPLLGEHKPRSPYHGSDGFGDVPDPNAPDESCLQTEHGVMSLLRLSKAYKGMTTRFYLASICCRHSLKCTFNFLLHVLLYPQEICI